MKYYQNKNAIVTGGGSGIGRALSQQLAQAGAIVVVADVNGPAALKTADDICRAGGRAWARQVDVADAEAVQALVSRTVFDARQLDFMFNNAGITMLGEVRDQTLNTWKRVMDINLMGVIYGTDAAYRQMVAQGTGHIVNTASLAGLVPQPTNVPYTASKHAVVGLSTSLRAEAADLGVRVSVVCPAFIQANMINEHSVVGVNVEDLHVRRKLALMPTADQAARAILRGVARNREIIVYPFYARLLWLLSRVLPATPLFMRKKVVRDFRKLREKAGQA